MRDRIPDYSHKRVWSIAGSIALICLLVAIWIQGRIPQTESVPYPLEVWIGFGWITGLYLSFSFMLLRPLFPLLFKEQTVADVEAAHGVLFVLASSGICVWAITKLLGYV
jgi:hypothetical protein